mgnify:CR=1 FL=1
MSSSNTRYKQIVHSDGNSNKLFGTNSTRWPSYDSRWDDPNRILCLAAGAGDLLALKWALEERRLIIHGHPVRRSKIMIEQYNISLNQSDAKCKRHILTNNNYAPDWPDPFCYGWTALHRAASSGKKETIQFLLDHGKLIHPYDEAFDFFSNTIVLHFEPVKVGT